MYSRIKNAVFFIFPEMPPIVPEAYILKPSFRDLFLNKTAVVLCTTNVPNTDIEWVTSGNLTDKHGKRELIPRNGTTWVQNAIQVSLQEWKTISELTCKLKPPQDVLQEQLSIQMLYTQRNMKAPTVHLLPPAPESLTTDEEMTLLCLAKGFYPADLFVTWKVNVTKVHIDVPDPSKVSCDHQSRRCSTVSQLSISKAEWLKRTTYTCLVAHISSDDYIRKNINAPTDRPSMVPDAAIFKPSFKDIFLQKTANVSCRTNAPNTTIQWMADGKPRTQQDNNQTQHNDTWRQSTIQVSLQEWKTTSNFTCRLEPPPDDLQKQLSIIRTYTPGELKSPTVHLLPPEPESMSTDEQMTLLCLVKGFYPADLFVTWEMNNTEVHQDVPDPSKVSCDHQSRRCSTVSQLSISKVMWLNGTTYTCLVAHISSEDYIRRNINVNSATLSLGNMPSVYQDEGGEDSDPDETQNVWTTASTFIALFLLTLIYSSFVTFVKVK
ncbi:hypothetical protein FKM82_029687 [Ascaphus truei]